MPFSTCELESKWQKRTKWLEVCKHLTLETPWLQKLGSFFLKSFFCKVMSEWWACLQHWLIVGRPSFIPSTWLQQGMASSIPSPTPPAPSCNVTSLALAHPSWRSVSVGSQLLTHCSLSSLFGLLSTADYCHGYEVRPLQCQDAAAATVSHRTWTITEQKWSVLFFLLHFFTPPPHLPLTGSVWWMHKLEKHWLLPTW